LTINDFENEINLEADRRSVELIYLLIDKINISNKKDLLNDYVKMKIAYHHLKKRYFYGNDEYKSGMKELRDKIKEARKKYYESS
jgi:hypothetical protein